MSVCFWYQLYSLHGISLPKSVAAGAFWLINLSLSLSLSLELDIEQYNGSLILLQCNRVDFTGKVLYYIAGYFCGVLISWFENFNA